MVVLVGHDFVLMQSLPRQAHPKPAFGRTADDERSPWGSRSRPRWLCLRQRIL